MVLRARFNVILLFVDSSFQESIAFHCYACHVLSDLIDDDETFGKEQETLDAHDDLVAELSVRVKQVIDA